MNTRINDDIFTSEIHQRTDLSEYLDVIFGTLKIGQLDFWKTANDCRNITETPIPPFKIIRRYERLANLLRFQLRALEKCSGPVAECGVFRGMSALAMGRLMQVIPEKPEIDLWLIDSYAGLSKPTDKDMVERLVGGRPVKEPAMDRGHFSTPLCIVKKNLSDIKFSKFSEGWIPKVFDMLPETKWSFVHIDVDLYEPVFESLKYFYPRLEKHGILINDDFGSPLFPGAGKAWSEFFAQKQLGYAILDTGQAVFINS